MGLTAHLEKIQVNNHGQDENCLRARTAVCVGGADTQEVLHMVNHHQDTEKELGAVRLANALAQRTDNHSVLQLQQNV